MECRVKETLSGGLRDSQSGSSKAENRFMAINDLYTQASFVS